VTADVRRATEGDIRVFSEWTYEAPYDVYNITESPDEAVEYFLGPEVRCHVLVETTGQLVGFVTFGSDAHVPGGDYAREALDIGLGIDPELTGKGNGKRYIEAAVVFADATFGVQRMRVTIAANNVRAQRAWKSVGFVQTDDFLSPHSVMGTKKFVVLELG
jgi:ribosomal-protein-alanine N-acetyltransferase